MGIHEIKKLLATKDMVSKLKWPHTEWEKIFACNNISDKEPKYTESSKS
jgi:hypothetical protein